MEEGQSAKEESAEQKIQEVAVFGGGCFWCTEAVFERLKGVISVMPGYAGGTTAPPAYEEVAAGRTGHAEVIKVEFDPSRISYADLLTVFFATHDPTAFNRQGNDIGPQYRSIILYTNEDQKREAERFIKTLNAEGKPVVTEVKALEQFFEAEENHRAYYRKNASAPYCQVVINPKLKILNERFQQLLLSSELYRVAREKETEAPFSGKYLVGSEQGMYRCAVCGMELFSSDTKFDSGTGWPSFTEPANVENVELREEVSRGMRRTEVLCKKCGAHLGHVFDDGPREKGGRRYCINSVCLELEKKGSVSE